MVRIKNGIIDVLLGIFLINMKGYATEASRYREVSDTIWVGFWNMENFFDPFVDTTRIYNEFTKDGSQHWTVSRFYRKRNHMYKVLVAMSLQHEIGILGVCEIENEYVLNSLFGLTPLRRYEFRWVHYEGPDRRGIDPAIVYSKRYFDLIDSEAIPYHSRDDPSMISRDILYAKFCDKKGDTIHCFVNHWPSKYSGEIETVEARVAAARILRHKVDSLHGDGKILIMGDFNDTPESPSIREVLGAETNPDRLINLFDRKELNFNGTLKYQDEWSVFDQIIVSKSLIRDEGLHCIPEQAQIFVKDFMLIDDPTYFGKKLWRTYIGPKYYGGFSDHLPVCLPLMH